MKQFKFFAVCYKVNILDIHKFWASRLYHNVDKQNLNLYWTNLRKKRVLPIFIFLSNQMNCEIIAEGKLGEEDRHFPIYIIFLDIMFGKFLKWDFCKSKF